MQDSTATTGTQPSIGGRNVFVRWLRSPLGALLARAWFDRLAYYLLTRWYFPLSRLWAAAHEAEGSVERFLQAVPIRLAPRLNDRLAQALQRFEVARGAAAAVERRWEAAFFGPDDSSPAELVAIEMERIDRRTAYNAARRYFRFLRKRGGPSIRWDTPRPEQLDAPAYAEFMEARTAFAPPAEMPEVEVSRSVPAATGRDYWLRFQSPSPLMNDTVFARVHEPEGVENPPTLIFAHGVCVDFDHWQSLIDEVSELRHAGIRVVRPEAPWHGRRAPPGRFSGETFFARGPLGALELFTAAVREQAVLMDWCRRHTTGPVAVGGSSLGAMITQATAVNARDWPERLRPDALFLITPCARHEDAAANSLLAKDWDTTKRMAEMGWTREHTARITALIDPHGAPAVDPARIVAILGGRDRMTPFHSGLKLVEDWNVPPENVFIWPLGHFSIPLRMMRDTSALDRFRAILTAL
jgi:pimeloyl-ACP methyl ester carboxylesterase